MANTERHTSPLFGQVFRLSRLRVLGRGGGTRRSARISRARPWVGWEGSLGQHRCGGWKAQGFLRPSWPAPQVFVSLQLFKYLDSYFLAKPAFILETLLGSQGNCYSVVCSGEDKNIWEMLFK